MRIQTTRFGALQVGEDELFQFPQGIIGMETFRQWVLVPDPENDAVGWLQSASRENLAISVISPRVFAPRYRVHVRRRDLSVLRLRPEDRTYVLSVLSGRPGHLVANLRAPIVVNLGRRLGCQVVTTDEQPIRYPVPSQGKAVAVASGRLAA